MVVKYVLALALITALAHALDDTHIKDPSFYRCPFSMFDAGRPVTNELGEVQYCDVEGARCPSWYFCSYGYTDGRYVCCHILGV